MTCKLLFKISFAKGHDYSSFFRSNNSHRVGFVVKKLLVPNQLKRVNFCDVEQNILVRTFLKPFLTIYRVEGFIYQLNLLLNSQLSFNKKVKHVCSSGIFKKHLAFVHNPRFHILTHNPKFLIVPLLKCHKVFNQIPFALLNNRVKLTIIDIKEGLSRQGYDPGIILFNHHLGLQWGIKVDFRVAKALSHAVTVLKDYCLVLFTIFFFEFSFIYSN